MPLAVKKEEVNKDLPNYARLKKIEVMSEAFEEKLTT